MSLTPEQIAWAAGIYEGEGCVSWTNAEHRCQEVVVIQKERWILDKLETLFGGKVDLRKEQVFASGKRYESHRWRLSGPNARNFLTLIYSWLSPRRQQQIIDHQIFADLDGLIDPKNVAQLLEIIKGLQK